MKTITTILLTMLAFVGLSQNMETDTRTFENGIKSIEIKGFAEIYFVMTDSDEHTVQTIFQESEDLNSSFSVSTTNRDTSFSLKQSANDGQTVAPSKIIISGDLNSIKNVELKGNKASTVHFPTDWGLDSLDKWRNSNKVNFIRNYDMSSIEIPSSQRQNEWDLAGVNHLQVIGFDVLQIDKNVDKGESIMVDEGENDTDDIQLDRNGDMLTIELTGGVKKGSEVRINISEKLNILQVVDVNHFDGDSSIANVVITTNNDRTQGKECGNK